MPAQTTNAKLRWVVYGLLFLVTTINYIDRSALGLVEPILKHLLGGDANLALYNQHYSSIVTCFIVAYGLGFLVSCLPHYTGRLPVEDSNHGSRTEPKPGHRVLGKNDRSLGPTERNKSSVPHPFRFFLRKGWETTNPNHSLSSTAGPQRR